MCQLDQVVIVVGPNEFVILNVSVEARNGKNQKEKKTEGERRERRSLRPTKSNKAKKVGGLTSIFSIHVAGSRRGCLGLWAMRARMSFKRKAEASGCRSSNDS